MRTPPPSSGGNGRSPGVGPTNPAMTFIQREGRCGQDADAAAGGRRQRGSPGGVSANRSPMPCNVRTADAAKCGRSPRDLWRRTPAGGHFDKLRNNPCNVERVGRSRGGRSGQAPKHRGCGGDGSH
jgi:hypothetical protein